MSTTFLLAENERLKAENADLRAKLAAREARGDAAWNGALREASLLTPQQMDGIREGSRLYAIESAIRAGFDGHTAEGREAHREWRHRRVEAGRPPYLEPDETPAPAAAVVKAPAAPVVAAAPAAASRDFAEVYLPPAAATAEAIARSAAIARGEVTPLPTDPKARAILKAAAKARNEPWSDDP